MALVVHRHPPGEELPVGGDGEVGGLGLVVEHVRHAELRHAHLLRPARVDGYAPAALLGIHERAVGHAVVGAGVSAMDESRVGQVGAVLGVVEEVAAALVAVPLEDAFEALEVRIAGQQRRLALAEISEHEAQVLLAGVRADLHLVGEGFRLGGLLDALPGVVVFPAVIEAAHGVALDPAGGKLCPAVGAARIEEVRAASGPAVQRVVDVHDPDRLRLARGKVGRVVHRLPEAPHVLAGQSARPRVLEVEPALAFLRHSALIPALSMTEPHCLLSALMKRVNSSAL